MRTLDLLQPGEQATIVAFVGDAALTQRLHELGMMEGEVVEVITLAPLGDPMEVRVANTRLSLRRSEARAIRVTP